MNSTCFFLQDGFPFKSLEQYFDLQHKMGEKYCNTESLHFVIMLQYVDCDCKLNTCGYEDATKRGLGDLSKVVHLQFLSGYLVALCTYALALEH